MVLLLAILPEAVPVGLKQETVSYAIDCQSQVDMVLALSPF